MAVCLICNISGGLPIQLGSRLLLIGGAPTGNVVIERDAETGVWSENATLSLETTFVDHVFGFLYNN